MYITCVTKYIVIIQSSILNICLNYRNSYLLIKSLITHTENIHWNILWNCFYLTLITAEISIHVLWGKRLYSSVFRSKLLTRKTTRFLKCQTNSKCQISWHSALGTNVIFWYLLLLHYLIFTIVDMWKYLFFLMLVINQILSDRSKNSCFRPSKCRGIHSNANMANAVTSYYYVIFFLILLTKHKLLFSK